jgi:hypothetical protein
MMFGDDDLGNLIAVASMEPIEPDFAKMERRYQDHGIRKDLARLGMNNLVSLLSHHRVSQKQFGQLTGPGPLNTVGRQRLEYMAPRSFFLRENSLYLDSFDPLIRGVAKKTDLMLDRYIAYRAEVGNPMSQKELVDAARYAVSMGGYGRQIAKSIVARIH